MKKDELLIRLQNITDLLNQIQNKLVITSADLREKQKTLEKYLTKLKKSSDSDIDLESFQMIEKEAYSALLNHLKEINERYALGIEIQKTINEPDFSKVHQLWNTVIDRIVSPIPLITAEEPIKATSHKKKKNAAIIEDWINPSAMAIGISHLFDFQFQLLYGKNNSRRPLTLIKMQEAHQKIIDNIHFDDKKIHQIATRTEEKWLSRFYVINTKVDALIQKIQDNYRTIQSKELIESVPANPKKLHELWLSMEKDIAQLNELNEEQLELSERLSQFQEAYYVEENSHEALVSITKQERENLHTELKNTLLILLSIKPEKNDKVMEKIVAQTTDFISTLTSELKTVFDETTVNQLQNELLRHFHVNSAWEIKSSRLTNLLPFTSRQNTLPLSIDDILENLIHPSKAPITESASIDQLKKTIASVRQIRNQLTHLNLDKMVRLYKKREGMDLAKKELTEQIALFEKNQSPVQENMGVLIRLLEKNRYLINNEFSKPSSILEKTDLHRDQENIKMNQKIIKMIQEISDLQIQLIQLQQKKKQEIDSRLPSIQSITKLAPAERNIASLLKIQKDLSQEQEMIHLKLEEKIRETNSLLKETHLYLKTTNDKYQANISKKIADIRDLMSFMGEEENQIQHEILSKAEKTLNYINHQAEAIENRTDYLKPLSMIDERTDEPNAEIITRLAYINAYYIETMEALDRPTQDVVKKLTTELEQKYLEVAHFLRTYPAEGINAIPGIIEPKQLTELRTSCNADALRAQELDREMRQIINNTGRNDPSLLRQVHQQFISKHEETKSLVNIIGEKLTLMTELTNRFQSPKYKASAEVTEHVRLEFERLLHKYGRKKPSILEEINQDNTNGQAELVFNEKQKKLLGKIDQRLPILLAMYHDFNTLNHDYINRSKDISSTMYEKKLHETIDKNLGRQTIERLSSGINNRFWQWLRVHVLKLLNKNPTVETVTPTLGASQTEIAATEWRNKFFNTKPTKPEGPEEPRSESKPITHRR